MPTPTTLRRTAAAILSGLALAASAGMAEVVGSQPEASPTWYGVDRQPLPFTSDERVLDYLRHAEIVASEVLASGSTRPLKVTLERDGVRAHAIFRTVDRRIRRGSLGYGKTFRDSYRFEVAAFELGRLLGLDNVPPAVLREVRGREGSMQLWIEEARSEASRIRRGEQPEKASYWYLQRQVMLLFDNLIFNFDRNPGNLLTTTDGKLWLVDHTRSFKDLPVLSSAEEINVWERRIVERLRRLEPVRIRTHLGPYLEETQLRALLARRERILARVDRLIAERGESYVLFDLERRASLDQTTTRDFTASS